MNYNLELNKIAEEIKKFQAGKVLLQFPDGLKPKAEEAVNFLNKKTNADIFIFLGECYGGCDFPLEVNNLGIDLIIQFGHNKFVKSKEW
ncbi:MAG: diphthamide synthesis protein [Candidatus Pacearchaeota archaeon]